jgi:hypothetical protein
MGSQIDSTTLSRMFLVFLRLVTADSTSKHREKITSAQILALAAIKIKIYCYEKVSGYDNSDCKFEPRVYVQLYQAIVLAVHHASGPLGTRPGIIILL